MCARCANETCACERPMKMHTSQDGRRVDSDGNAGSALLKSEELVDVCAEGFCSQILSRLRLLVRSGMPARRHLAAASNLRASAQYSHSRHPGMAKCT